MISRLVALIVVALTLFSFALTHAASIQEIETAPAGAGGWIASYALMTDATVIGNMNLWSPGGHPFQFSPSVSVGNFWGSTPSGGAIAFYEVVALGLMRDPAVHYVLLPNGDCYARTSHQNFSPGIQPFNGDHAVSMGNFWNGAAPAQITSYKTERDGNTGVDDVIVHLVYLANGDAWYRVSGGTEGTAASFQQPPYRLGKFHDETPLPVRTSTLGGVKAKYR